MKISLSHTKNLSIFEQLQQEEALLRIGKGNWCLINEGSSPAIVLGLSSSKQLEIQKSSSFPIIKRFSGGGSVVIDKNTVFVTFIFDKNTFSFPSFPETILQWSQDFFYQFVFNSVNFSLIENDFAIDNCKCGGNALYIQKDRWLLHTSFLWDYSNENMNILSLPKKQPKYRNNRSHLLFLCRLRKYFKNKNEFITALLSQLKKRFKVEHACKDTIYQLQTKPHRKSTHYI